MPSLREKFVDAVTVPSGDILSSRDPEFLDVFNHVFAFHDSKVSSWKMDLPHRRLEVGLSYIASQRDDRGRLLRRWRPIEISLEGIISLEFSSSSSEFGIPHYVIRRIDLESLAHNDPDLVPQVGKVFAPRLEGAVLDAIEVVNSGSRFRVHFDWLTTKTQTTVVEWVTAAHVSLRFVSEPGVEVW